MNIPLGEGYLNSLLSKDPPDGHIGPRKGVSPVGYFLYEGPHTKVNGAISKAQNPHDILRTWDAVGVLCIDLL